MNELEVVVKQELGSVKFNFEEIRANVESIAKAYEDATFHEDTCVAAKKEVATLRKIQKAIDDKRKEVKRECMKPYDEFEVKVKEILAIIEKPILHINTQVSVFEESKRLEKRKKIEELHATLIDEVIEYLPLDKIFNPKWENATYTIPQIKDDLSALADKVTQAVDTIKSMNSECEQKALDLFKQDLDMIKAIQYVTSYEQQKAEIVRQQEERMKQEQERRIREEEQARIRAEQQKAVEIASAVEQAKAETVEMFVPETEDTLTWLYEIELGADGKQKLEMFMQSVGIEYKEKGMVL